MASILVELWAFYRALRAAMPSVTFWTDSAFVFDGVGSIVSRPRRPGQIPDSACGKPSTIVAVSGSSRSVRPKPARRLLTSSVGASRGVSRKATASQTRRLRRPPHSLVLLRSSGRASVSKRRLA
eukprot:5343617-Pyramimonas_sp.AAC.1